MIRWGYVLPRLFGVGLVLAFLTFGLPPAVRWLTVTALQTATGAKVDLERVDVGLFPPRLVYHQLHLANPGSDKAMRNLLSTESIELNIDGGEMLRRRYVISSARVTGLQFDTERLSDGHLEPTAEEPSEPSWAAAWISDRIGMAGDAAADQLQGWVDESHLNKRGDQIRRRWKSEYAQLATRAEDLETAMRDVHETAKGIENPLRDLPRIDAALTKAKGIQQELVSVRKKLESLPSDIQADLASMEEAKEADLQRVRDAVPFDLDAVDDLGPALVRETLRREFDRFRGYLDTGREVSRWTVAEPKFERQRGEVIDLTAGRRQPNWMVRHCELSGLVRSGGQTHQLTGVLQNVTSQPELRDQPLRAKFRIEGEQLVMFDYLRDDSAAPAMETWRLHWPEMKAPTVRLGSADTLDLDVRDGRIEWWVELRTRGERIDGRVVSRRTETRIELDGPTRVRETPMFVGLRDALAQVDQIRIDAEVTGSWDAPEFRVETDLTERLKTGVQDAAKEQIADVRRRMASEVDRFHARQLDELREWLGGQQQQADRLLAKADTAVQEISRKVMAETQRGDAYLGKLRGKLPGLR
ncbi:MAG: TIGR03545 family protein [Planctomycetaceae bacterium]|nr:MAG: TIGR03545 family protein [Planctomycetaceae bacterium]